MFDDFDWGGLARNVVASTVQAIPAIYAGNRGAKMQMAGNAQAAQIAQAGAQERINQIKQGNERAIAQFRPVLAQSPNVLTPQQDIALADAQRDLNNSNLLGRLGGRAYTRAFSDMTDRYRAGAVADNTRRQDAARTNISAIERGTGQQVSAPLADAANVAGQAAISDGAVKADTLGAIGSYFANAIKEGDRERRYREYAKGV